MTEKYRSLLNGALKVAMMLVPITPYVPKATPSGPLSCLSFHAPPSLAQCTVPVLGPAEFGGTYTSLAKKFSPTLLPEIMCVYEFRPMHMAPAYMPKVNFHVNCLAISSVGAECAR